MKNLFVEFRQAVISTVVLAFVCCVIYPLIVFGIGQVFFHAKANGSLIMDKAGAIRGSALIGQSFSGEKYFHPRPSAAGANGYDGTSSSGSNLGPTSQKLRDSIQERVAIYRKENGLGENIQLPADAVTASASGLDPHISVRNAELQVSRLARVRRLDEAKILALIHDHTDGPDLGILGEPAVNVLMLNIALDELR